MIHSSIHELSRHFAGLENKLDKIAVNKLEVIDYAAVQEKIIVLNRNVTYRFPALAPQSSEMQTACWNAVMVLIKFHVQILSDDSVSFSPVITKFRAAQGALLAIDQAIDGAVTDILRN